MSSTRVLAVALFFLCVFAVPATASAQGAPLTSGSVNQQVSAGCTQNCTGGTGWLSTANDRLYIWIAFARRIIFIIAGIGFAVWAACAFYGNWSWGWLITIMTGVMIVSTVPQLALWLGADPDVIRAIVDGTA